MRLCAPHSASHTINRTGPSLVVETGSTSSHTRGDLWGAAFISTTHTHTPNGRVNNTDALYRTAQRASLRACSWCMCWRRKAKRRTTTSRKRHYPAYEMHTNTLIHQSSCVYRSFYLSLSLLSCLVCTSVLVSVAVFRFSFLHLILTPGTISAIIITMGDDSRNTPYCTHTHIRPIPSTNALSYHYPPLSPTHIQTFMLREMIS